MTCVHLPWPQWTPGQVCTCPRARAPPCVMSGSWERRCVLVAGVTGVDLLLATSEGLTSTSLAAKYILLLIFCLLPHEWMGITPVSLDASVL